jgi:outer membrane protein OmpA-like peptidoglycan-associated protein
MGRLATLGVILPALLLALGGCATKDWVNELFGKKEARLDTAIGESRVRADAAQGRADAAFGRAEEVDQRLTRLWSGRHKRNVVETINVQFAFDRWELSDGAQTALLGVVKELKENPALTVDLEGYTDPVGARDYNIALSQRRVEAVRRYLVQSGAELPRISAIGLGPLTGVGRDEDHGRQRRVSVRLMVPLD